MIESAGASSAGVTARQEQALETGDAQSSWPRYIVGIDLGTTNSALCFIDTAREEARIECFLVPQAVSAGEVECLETLPSFRYELLPTERDSGMFRLPWHKHPDGFVVGAFARDHGRSVPGRLTESAKSWLCHSGVDRKAALLPWHGAEDVERRSPVEVSAGYLTHLREAWDAAFPAAPLSHQSVVLTIPASFDEVARELTVAAARLAGLPRVVLIEEPQAAFYSWVAAHPDSWEQQVSPGQRILVCDIGGGTSDFSLIHVRTGDAGRLQFHRIAVGEHLLLGGDNLDLALAHHLERRLMGDGTLEPRQWSVLIPACRHAKELLLAESSVPATTIVLPGSGARLIGGSLQIEITREEVQRLIVEGFLPKVALTAKPQRRRSGFQEFGLPYAADPAISRYLAAFLSAHPADPPAGDRDDTAGQCAAGTLAAARPDMILFNGGFFASPVLRQRLIECIEEWFRPVAPGWSPIVLKNDRLDLAVARGAAQFGLVRRGGGVRIIAGLARTYYVGVEQPDGSQAAMCLVAAGTEPSTEHRLIDREFEVRTAEPVEFPILVSATRLTDRPGDVLPLDVEQMSALPPIRTVLTARSKQEPLVVKARLSARLTEIGTLEMRCEQSGGDRRWQLQFDVRSATETDRQAHAGAAERAGLVDESVIQRAAAVVFSVFGDGQSQSPDSLMRRIGEATGQNRMEWPPSLLRGLWSALMAVEGGRRRSPAHEARWLNLAGFCLRPGFGMAADDWRVEETWRVLKGKLVHGGAACLTEWRILCRRVAGGLTASRQNQLATPLVTAIARRHRQLISGKGRVPEYSVSPHEAAEIWRMLGSLELLDRRSRIELGNIIVELWPLPSEESLQPALTWTLGRLGARVLVSGPLNLVLPVTVVGRWIDFLLDSGAADAPEVHLALMQMCRRTGDRYRDVPESTRQAVSHWLQQAGARTHLIELIRDGGELERDEAGLVFGESLPAGLRLR